MGEVLRVRFLANRATFGEVLRAPNGDCEIAHGDVHPGKFPMENGPVSKAFVVVESDGAPVGSVQLLGCDRLGYQDRLNAVVLATVTLNGTPGTFEAQASQLMNTIWPFVAGVKGAGSTFKVYTRFEE